MLRQLIVWSFSLLFSFSAMAQEDSQDGLIHIKSAHSVDETSQRLIGILEQKGMTIFNQIAHSDGAEKVGVTLRPTQLILFGNPKVGSPLMKCAQTVAIDLPQKALIWEDEKGDTYISYNSPDYLQARHQIESCEKNLSKVGKALNGLLSKAASE